jgi:hypothetical protein
MSFVDPTNRASPMPLRSIADVRSEAPAAKTVSAPVSEREVLQARADAGHTLTPVEQGNLARLNAAVAKPKTVSDFKLTHATAKDKADLKATLEYLQQTGPDGKPLSPTAVKLLQQLPKGFHINITHNGDDSYDPNTKTINWDPRSALEVSSGAGKQSAALGLIHEIDHAANGQRSPTPTGDGYENTEEKRVITGSETTIAHDLGEPTRTDHYGTATSNEKSSTTHTKVAYPKVTPEVMDKVREAVADVVRRVEDLLKHIF